MSERTAAWAGRLAVATGAAAVARVAWTRLRAAPPGGQQRWQRTNHRGEPITLLEGPAATVATVAALVVAPGVPARLRLAGAVAGLGAGAFGLLDDLGERGSSKGLRGHLGALRRGEITTGALKIAGIGAAGLIAGGLAVRERPSAGGPLARTLDVATAAATIAGAANLINLLDLRPGRALKVVLLQGLGAAAVTGPAGAVSAALTGTAVALLPEDLGERAMLGDCGANALGALIGTAVVAGASRPTRTLVLGGLVGLTLASEKVSFTKVIESTPGLRELDAWGRRPR